MENYRELIEEKLDNVILQHSYSRNREKRVGSEYVEFVDWLVEELGRAREEGRQESWKECEEFYGDMREILRPYHREGEDYRTTLKRQLKLLEEENGKQNAR